MKILIFGYHQICYLCLEHLLKNEENIIALFTHKSDKKENIWFKTPDIIARRHNVPVYYPDNVNSNRWRNFVTKKLKPDVIFSIYYRKIIGEDIINFPRVGSINLHASYLPYYRGRAPLNWVLANGEKYTGVTLHYMISRPDAGDIIKQKKISIFKNDDINSLYKKFHKIGLELFKKTYPLIKIGKVKGKKQNEKKTTYFGRRKLEDGLINWNLSVKEIYNLIRAVTYPYPGAFTYLNGKKFIIWRAKIYKGKKIKPPVGIGVVVKENVYIGAGKGTLKIIYYKCDHMIKEKILSFQNKNNIDI